MYDETYYDNIKSINTRKVYLANTSEPLFETKIKYLDDTTVYIFIYKDHIYVSDYDWYDTRELIANGSVDVETYDLSEEMSYYMNSDYAQLISDAIIASFRMQMKWE